MIHVPANLFDHAGIGDPWPKHLARPRRLLVTMWLVCAGRPASPEAPAAARAVWDRDVNALARHGRVTVATVLIQLRDLGFVRSLAGVQGGFDVELVKEAA